VRHVHILQTHVSDGFAGTAAPFNWHRPVYELDLHDESNNGYKNEDLIVWMRAAAFPSFRKLYRRIDHSSSAVTAAITDATDDEEEEDDDTDADEENAVIGKEVFTSGLPAGNYTLTVGYGRYIYIMVYQNQLFAIYIHTCRPMPVKVSSVG